MIEEPNELASGSRLGLVESPDLLLVIQQALDSDPELKEALIDIVARGGTITLLGNVRAESIKLAVERAIRSVSGMQVDNQIQVSDQSDF